MIKVAIAEDISKIAEALSEKIHLSSDFTVTFNAKNGKEIRDYIFQGNVVDVIIMDINMPEMNGIEATQLITAHKSSPKIIMSTVFDDEQYLFDAIMAGASGYLLKDEPPAKIHKSIFEALEGGAPMSAIIAQKSLQLIRRNQKNKVKVQVDFELTKRELEILNEISKGFTYDQISNRLYISNGTVRKHIENIYRKMKVHNKIEAIDKGKKNGLI
jgi:DNA-binding NarL/FixJ family response regulator